MPTAWLTLASATGTADVAAPPRPHRAAPVGADVTAEQIERCHDAGILVNVWTCNDPAALRRPRAAGVDGIVTDVPDLVRAAIDGHG